jgi:septal ring factor EnvC (AmiA/AmiB activator)
LKDSNRTTLKNLEINNTVKWDFIPTAVDYNTGEEDMVGKEVEARLAGLEKSLEELQSAIRRIAQENNGTLTTLGKISEGLATVKAEVATLKTESEIRTRNELNLGRTKY